MRSIVSTLKANGERREVEQQHFTRAPLAIAASALAPIVIVDGARQRYLRASKAELVERLLIAENAYAAMENRWLRTADDLLVWILVVDRITATRP